MPESPEWQTSPRPRPEHLWFLLPPGVHLLDLAGPAQVLTHQRLGGVQPHFIGSSKELCAAQGLALYQLEPLPRILPPRSWLLVIGCQKSSELLRSANGRRLAQWLARAAAQSDLTACICSGALLAAQAGLLDGRSCTTHHQLLTELRAMAPHAQVKENCLFTHSGNLWTSAGIASGMDLCLHLVAMYWGYEAANTVARDLVLYHRRSGGDPQLDIRLQHRNHVNQRLHQLQDRILQNPGYPWTVQALAEESHLSPRHLSRLFKEQLGLSPKSYLQQVRLAYAEQLLREGGMTVDQVAEAVGYESARQLRRLWHRYRGGPPSQSIGKEAPVTYRNSADR
ncbi:GlxA family transcriptional regulator [Microbulbifer thermotolerans]|uniref:Helix-turn-helix domain-containing protein n=1 Tax=Microbulbifer thermotolerans TaxID=252514 RepID=A0AB35HWG7_MICTH|nr:helix-turn-helix domain-containing protein [Microbulbifer thermotolerans]MCX2778176.1 helix-turn-helix domain-containing protein [Microbulbifer thermotolerans]MCX2801156.1 helix-turn-helix domain-containing protein [Microbulbifer thermotolerans]MCX2804524.1 helix-turn-helix domain-containing protein [Microbulbifer thermotolerans]MCX2835231.1 helix-turn-helix domain-containing protein [Microbulbifer thermotolerans]WKT60165.1 helix-turn-helix domain-containing protein [Microbulbifer thermotol